MEVQTPPNGDGNAITINITGTAGTAADVAAEVAQALRDTELRAKYTQAEIDDLGAKGHAFKNPDGSYSYPVDDAEDLGNAITAVGLGNSDHDAIRKYLIGRADALGKSSEIPDTWNADGSIKESKSTPVLHQTRAAMATGRKGKDRHRAVPLVPEVRIRRTEGPLEIREADKAGNLVTIRGAVIVYDEPYSVWDMFGEFEERMAPGVARDVLTGDTRYLYNHEGMVLARTVAGTLGLEDTPQALWTNATVDIRNSVANNLVIAVQRGDVSQMSVGFICGLDEWNDSFDQRYVLRFREMPDVSAVSFPCSPTTSLEVMQRMALAMPAESRARLRRFYADTRAGKVLSDDNQGKIVDAAKSLHEVLTAAGFDPEDLIDGEASSTEDGTEGGNTGDQGESPTFDDGSGSRQNDPGEPMRAVPATAAERREAALSFGDQESAVYQALLAQYAPEEGGYFDLWVCDLSTDWVVYECYDGPDAGLWRSSYACDDEGNVTLTGDPCRVAQQTSYVPLDEPDASEDDAPSSGAGSSLVGAQSFRTKTMLMQVEERKRWRESISADE